MTITAPEFIECEGCHQDFPPAELSTTGLCEECQDEAENFDAWDEFDIGPHFASEGSALRAATIDDPRIHPCPSCDAPNRLTQQDVDLGYQCDRCADRAESGLDY